MDQQTNTRCVLQIELLCLIGELDQGISRGEVVSGRTFQLRLELLHHWKMVMSSQDGEKDSVGKTDSWTCKI